MQIHQRKNGATYCISHQMISIVWEALIQNKGKKVVDVELLFIYDLEAGDCIEIASPVDSVLIRPKRFPMPSSL